MASPLQTRGKKSIANLKRGGRHGPPPKSTTDEARKLSRKLLNDSAYRKALIRRLRAGTIQPGVEALLYYFAYGKPRETIETAHETQVKIVHQYADDDKKK